MNYLYNTLHTIVTKFVDTGLNTVRSCIGSCPSPAINTCFIFAFFSLSKMWTRMNMAFTHNLAKIKQNNPALYTIGQSWKTRFYKMSEWIYSTLYRYRIEPNEPVWINSSTIQLSYPNLHSFTYTYCEKYEYTNTDLNETPIQQFNTMRSIVSTNQFIQDNTVINDNNIMQLFILKYDDVYLYRIKLTNLLEERSISKIRFLSIVYSHPKMAEPIHMEIPKNALLCKNEILSSAFILRYLEYQSRSFVFDMNYTLNIIDGHVNQFNMKCHQYILLDENSYKVLDVYN